MDENGKNTALNLGAAGEETTAPEQEQQGALTAAEIEKLVEQILAKRLAQFRIEASGRVAQARSEGRAEAERLAGMSEDERRRYEAEAAKAREDELARREEELRRREVRAWVAEELVARELPRELAEFVECGDAARCAECVDALEKAFRAAVQQAVDARLNRGHTLPRSGGESPTSLTQRMRAAAGLDEG